MAEKEIEINGKKISESTKVTLTLSTIGWIVGALLFVISTLATVGYLDIKNDVNNQKATFSIEKQLYKEDIKKVLEDGMKYERERREKIMEDIGEIKGDIKVILEKTKNLEGGHNSSVGFTTPDNSTAVINR